jgi:hypothetical protein
MTLEEFRRAVQTVEGDEADTLRRRFVDRFVDTSKRGWKRILETTREYSDGIAYVGYLWDALARWERIPEDDLVTELERSSGDWVVFWDVNTSEYIHVPDYWKFPKSGILRARPATLAEGRAFLPEDVYFVPDDFGYALVATHEENPPGSRICVRALPRE